ncbi:MAG: HAMP domain-containing histidine kinase [Actinobacteria bacterium]|nr:HAMP domain-containing histidine kinase [Actinomycetota bacterium]
MKRSLGVASGAPGVGGRRRFKWLRIDRPHIARAVRVAGIVTLVIALVYVGIVAAADMFLSRRLLWEMDQRLTERLADVSRMPDPVAVPVPADSQGADATPVFVWKATPTGSPSPMTSGAPTLPSRATESERGPVTVRTVSGKFRLVAAPYGNDWLIAGQNTASLSHISGVVIAAELITAPLLLLAVFAGVLVIALKAVEPVEDARRRQLEFTADASHELRTPLTVIEAEIELARSGGYGIEDYEDTLNSVSRESRRLHRIVEDLLWLARSDAEPDGSRGEPVELTDVVKSCAERFTPVARSRGITMDVGQLGGGDVRVEVDAESLDKLVGTLLDNGCRYAPEGGTVRISTLDHGGRVALVVEDSGPGVPEEERDHLFDRFRRATDHGSGAGLGLAIADAVVRASGGRWRVADSELGGALFEVSWRRGPRNLESRRPKGDPPDGRGDRSEVSWTPDPS